jgi:hypothetical protein
MALAAGADRFVQKSLIVTAAVSPLFPVITPFLTVESGFER